LWFAYYDLYIPIWSQTIFDELSKIMLEKGMTSDIANEQINRINCAFPDAMVSNYQELIATLI